MNAGNGSGNTPVVYVLVIITPSSAAVELSALGTPVVMLVKFVGLPSERKDALPLVAIASHTQLFDRSRFIDVSSRF